MWGENGIQAETRVRKKEETLTMKMGEFLFEIKFG